MGCFKRTASKQVYYLGWNRSPAQVGCMRQVLRAGALGRPRGMGWRGRREGGSGWGTHVNPWLIHVSVWQKPLQYCKEISLQLIKINGKKRKDPDAGKDWRQEEKGTLEYKMAGWHHGLNRHEFISSRSCWRTGKPGELQSMGSQNVRHDWGNEQ